MKPTEKTLIPKITPQFIEKITKEWTRQEIASAIDMRVREIEKIEDVTFLEMGYCIIQCERQELFKELGFSGFTAWMNSGRVKGSRSKRYAARAAMLSMIEINVPAEEGYQLPRGNAQVLAKVSKQNRPQLLEAAKTMEKREFLRHIEKTFPDEHVEDLAPMTFKPVKSQRKKIDTAIEAVQLLNPEVTSREESLEVLAIDYLESHQEELEAAMGEAAKAASA